MVNVLESTLEWTLGDVIVKWLNPALGPIHHVFLWIRPLESCVQRTQSTCRGRVEIGGVHLSQLERAPNFVCDGRYSGVGVHPSPPPGWADFSIMIVCTQMFLQVKYVHISVDKGDCKMSLNK